MGWAKPTLSGADAACHILLGHPQACAAQLLQAVELSYVNELLPLLPQRLETEVGDNALRLSVGQAQRVAIARALIGPRRLLLLDEPAGRTA